MRKVMTYTAMGIVLMLALAFILWYLTEKAEAQFDRNRRG